MAASQLLKTVRIATYKLPESTKLMLQVSTHDKRNGSHLGRNVWIEPYIPATSPCVCGAVLNLIIDPSVVWILVLLQDQLKKEIDTNEIFWHFRGMPKIWNAPKSTS